MLQITDRVFFGRLLENFQDLALKQSTRVFEQQGVLVPVRSCSLLLAIGQHDGVSASELSALLGYSHQLVLQKIPKLRRLALISQRKDAKDERRRLFYLTEAGQQQIDTLERVLPAFAAAYDELFQEVGDMQALLRDATDALQKRSLEERILKKL